MVEPIPSAVNQNGGDFTRVDRPGIKEPGAQECASRTTAMMQPVKTDRCVGDEGRLGLDLREVQGVEEGISEVQKRPTGC